MTPLSRADLSPRLPGMGYKRPAPFPSRAPLGCDVGLGASLGPGRSECPAESTSPAYTASLLPLPPDSPPGINLSNKNPHCRLGLEGSLVRPIFLSFPPSKHHSLRPCADSALGWKRRLRLVSLCARCVFQVGTHICFQVST